MTDKQRWLQALNCEETDRILFWPKLSAGYVVANGGRADLHSLMAFYDWIGSDKQIFLDNVIKNVSQLCSVEIAEKDSQKTTVYQSRHGSTAAVHQFDKASQSWHPVSMPIRSKEDIEVMIEWYTDYAPDVDRDKLNSVKEINKDIGQRALTGVLVGESPLMYFVEWMAGVEFAHFLLIDYPELVEELFRQMHSKLLKEIEITCLYNPVDLMYLIENTSTTLISPDQFRKYCLKHLHEYTQLAINNKRRLAYHMCGHLKDILADLSELKGIGFEAFSSPPVGNVRLPEGRAFLKDKSLLGGTNAVLWTKPASEITAELDEDLSSLPDHRGIVVTSGGEMPPPAEPAKIKQVCEWVKKYKTRM